MYTLLSIIIRKWIFTWKDSHASLSTWCFSYGSSKCILDTKSLERRRRRLRMRETSSKAFVLRYLRETGNGRRSFVVSIFCQIMMMRGHEMRQFIVGWIVQGEWVQQMHLMFQVEMRTRKEWWPQLLSPDSSCLSLSLSLCLSVSTLIILPGDWIASCFAFFPLVLVSEYLSFNPFFFFTSLYYVSCNASESSWQRTLDIDYFSSWRS